MEQQQEKQPALLAALPPAAAAHLQSVAAAAADLQPRWRVRCVGRGGGTLQTVVLLWSALDSLVLIHNPVSAVSVRLAPLQHWSGK